MIAVKRILVAVGVVCMMSIGAASDAHAVSYTYAEYATYAKTFDAAEGAVFEPFWSHTASLSANLNINNRGRAVMAGMVVGNVGSSHVVVNAMLDRVNPNGTTTRIVTFNNIRQEGNVWTWERPHYVARGHDYRFTIQSTVFRNGQSETLSQSSRVVRAN